jgi:hypothetical protein
MKRITIKQQIKRITIALIACDIIVFLVIFADSIPLKKATPPQSMSTVEEFRKWKGSEIMDEGTYANNGTTYKVYLVPAGRYLASGPSAYLFTQNGDFVDWSADCGDYFTVKQNFDLTSGNIKPIKNNNNH